MSIRSWPFGLSDVLIAGYLDRLLQPETATCLAACCRITFGLRVSRDTCARSSSSLGLHTAAVRAMRSCAAILPPFSRFCEKLRLTRQMFLRPPWNFA